MGHRIYYDGLNLALPQGTGIATYTRVLARVARDLGHEVGIVYSGRRQPPKDAMLREIVFFDERNGRRPPKFVRDLRYVADQLRYLLPVRPAPIAATGAVIGRQFSDGFPAADRVFVSPRLFRNALDHFDLTARFADLAFEERPDVLHCTYQMPLRAKGACNIYTLHDLVPLRLPFATGENKRRAYRLLKKIAADADHIVTVSETSRRDIIQLLGADERRVTNTFQAVTLPESETGRPEEIVVRQLESFGLEFNNYLLFYGALEPKKNVGRIVEAYLASGVDLPLVLAVSAGWQNDAEQTLLTQFDDQASGRRRIRRLDYVSLPILIALIRGARAGLLPSLYEGFGLPLLEYMSLGTPVITSREGSLPEIAGDAALFVDAYDVDDIARAMRTIAADSDLRAELARRGKARAAEFSLASYRERVKQLYDRLR